MGVPDQASDAFGFRVRFGAGFAVAAARAIRVFSLCAARLRRCSAARAFSPLILDMRNLL